MYKIITAITFFILLSCKEPLKPTLYIKGVSNLTAAEGLHYSFSRALEQELLRFYNLVDNTAKASIIIEATLKDYQRRTLWIEQDLVTKAYSVSLVCELKVWVDNKEERFELVEITSYIPVQISEEVMVDSLVEGLVRQVLAKIESL